MIPSRLVVAVVLFWLSGCLVAPAQNRSSKASDKGIAFGEEKTSRWQVGMVVKADQGPLKSVYGTVPVPIDWPEQQVKVVDKQLTPGVRVSHRNLGGVRQMLVKMPAIRGGQTARAVVTFEIRRKSIVGPKDPDLFEIPKRIPRDIRRWLSSSPYIETRDSKIRSLAKSATKDVDGAWAKVEAVYDLVRDKVEYQEGSIKGAAKALRDGYGDCEELTSLFIAMCRINKVPARMVWVPDHCYPEFYLVDDLGDGHWIPCQAAGTRAFGDMPEVRPILQKGDNFKVPGKNKPQRYVAETAAAVPVRGSGEPKVTFIRKFVQPGG